jgi:hypothetical protein
MYDGSSKWWDTWRKYQGDNVNPKSFRSWTKKQILAMWECQFGVRRFFILDWWRVKLGRWV